MSEIAGISLRNGPTRVDPCERRGQELAEHQIVVAVDGLDVRHGLVADQQGESTEGRHGRCSAKDVDADRFFFLLFTTSTFCPLLP